MQHLTGQVAAITGAGSGIGRALALNLAKQGCHLCLADKDAHSLTQTAELLAAFNVTTLTQTLDVSDAAAMQLWADTCYAHYGKINLLFNNAGVALSGTLTALPLSDIQWIMNINFWGVVHGCQAFLPYLERSGSGHIINLSSIFGLTAQPLMGAYNASKFAVRGYTEALRQDLELTRSCVSATCVHPGGIQTNIAKSSRIDTSALNITGADKQQSIAEFEKLFIHSPDSAAKVILRGVKRNKRRVLIGLDAHFYDWMARLFPAAYQKLFTFLVAWKAKSLRK